MSSKAALKAAKSAIDSQNYDEAIKTSRGILENEPDNYFANVFLGRALEKTGQVGEAVNAYQAATQIKPQDELAWKGLCNALESLGSKGVAQYISSALELATIYANQDDAHQCQTVIDNLVQFAKQHGTRQEYQDALRVMLPTSPVFEFLEGRLPNAGYTYIKLAEIAEADEKETINRKIGERRTRLGARLDDVVATVTREEYARGTIEQVYRDIIDWTSDDELRWQYEEKYLQRVYDHLTVLPAENKPDQLKGVLKLARDMVVIKHPFELAWRLDLEWNDFENISELDKNVLREFVRFFPESGITKILTAYFGFRKKPVTNGEAQVNGKSDEQEEEQSTEKGEDEIEEGPLDSEERLALMADGLELASDSPFAHRLVSDYYLQILEYESCIRVSRKCLKLLFEEAKKSGLKLQDDNDATCLNLGTCLVYHQSPKNHPEAQNLFAGVLERKPNATSALLGIGLIYEEQENYAKAVSFLDRALERDPDNIRIAVECAWCKALDGDLENGLDRLQGCLEQLSEARTPARELISQTQYRVGKCTWDLKTDRASRKSRKGAYANLLASIKADPSFAPPYTLLGVYYSDYARDPKRARQCFQKAFELSAQEVLAAHRLAESFAEDGDWDIVELVAQRVIDSGVVKPSPGSKRKGISWPLSTMGIVQMNKQDFPAAVISFQAALRISPQDYNSWVGLGESYHSSGRYNAAKRTLEHALEIFDKSEGSEKWFAQYMLANVHRELGDFEDAIAAYTTVLEARPHEFGVSIAAIQTLVEQAWHNVETGCFGTAADSAKQAILAAQRMQPEQRDTFNFWKAVGDAAAVFSWIPRYMDQFPHEEIKLLLEEGSHEFEQVAPYDKITLASITSHDKEAPASTASEMSLVPALLCFKRALSISVSDTHAQAVAWFNLGWSQQRLYASTSRPRYLKAAVRAFKKAIELEARNADFWNALGVATTTLNPKVAQHSFVRSLHLNERSARTWTNLGALYLLQDDTELAHQAFGRAQSTDPDFPHAWVGEGLIALSVGDAKEALSHFEHAASIADGGAALVKNLYALSTFDTLLSASTDAVLDHSGLIDPLHALQQLQALQPSSLASKHLLALMQERISAYPAAAATLLETTDALEQEYETSESEEVMLRFAMAKLDLARCLLAADQPTTDENPCEAAIDHAETALDLSDTPSTPALASAYDTPRMRLSAHLTLGLAHFRLGAHDASIAAFRAALEEAGGLGARDAVVVLLAQVLWASQGGSERAVAEQSLRNIVQEGTQGQTYIDALLALAAMCPSDASLARLLAAAQSHASTPPSATTALETAQYNLSALAPSPTAPLTTAQSHTALHPASPTPWFRLAQLTADPHAADMAVATARGSLLSARAFGVSLAEERAKMDAEALARAYGLTGRAGDAQVGVVLAPWEEGTWRVLADAVELR